VEADLLVVGMEEGGGNERGWEGGEGGMRGGGVDCGEGRGYFAEAMDGIALWWVTKD